ncbi:MAG: 23S rRNA (pseudouridine(1915)-N(3))-methyltransferase RlmH [Acidobacteria bacterium]|nr:23S rRNA (pseudouridine(1915)-N(3))-methyltransferase RlmH [Acidobacteriota bacterium]
MGFYEARIRPFASCEIVETRQARGIDESQAGRIKDLEAAGFGKHLEGAYLICLDDRGKEMTSDEFARFLGALSLSRMTFSHELARVLLLEQVYRALTIIGGRHYAK